MARLPDRPDPQLEDVDEQIAQALEDEDIATSAGNAEAAERASIEAHLLIEPDLTKQPGPKKR